MTEVRLAAADGRATFRDQIMSHQHRRYGLPTANHLAADETLLPWKSAALAPRRLTAGECAAAKIRPIWYNLNHDKAA